MFIMLKGFNWHKVIFNLCVVIFFQEFYSTYSEPLKTFKTLELKGDMPEETITQIIDDMLSYVQE